MDRGNTIRYRG